MTFTSALPLTGERTVPGHDRESYWFARHEVVYRWVAARLGHLGGPGRVMVDAGCGEGYGAEILRANWGGDVVGLDYDGPTAAHVRAAYPGVQMVRANLAQLPLPDSSCAVLVSLQVIEHLWDLTGFLADTHRSLASGGAIVVSTPNRPVFSPGVCRGEKPTNPFHVEEFDAEQVRDLLAGAGFGQVAVHGLHHGARLRTWEDSHGPLVPAQISAALSDHWPAELDALIPSVTAADFDIGDADGAQDLIGIGWR